MADWTSASSFGWKQVLEHTLTPDHLTRRARNDIQANELQRDLNTQQKEKKINVTLVYVFMLKHWPPH